MPQKNKLKIVFLYDDSLDGSEGVANQVKVLGGWLSSRGHSVSYFVGETKITRWQGGRVYSLAKNIKVRFNGNRLSIPLPARKSNIEAALNVEKPDILHVQMPHSPFLSQRVMNAAQDVPAVGTFHIFPANGIARIGTHLLRYAYLGGLSRIAETVSVSRAAQEFAASSFKLRTIVVPNMVDISKFKSRAAVTVPDRVVFLGRLVERKGCRQLIEAFSIVSEQVPSSRLVIAGDGPERSRLEDLVMQRGLGDKVEFLGFVSEAERRKLLASASIACFPSRYGESFGIVLIEAMAAGAGVVLGGNNPGYASVMEDIPEALFDPNDPEKIAAKILQFLGDRSMGQSVHKAQSALVEKFNINSVGPLVEALYARAIDKASKTMHN